MADIDNIFELSETLNEVVIGLARNIGSVKEIGDRKTLKAIREDMNISKEQIALAVKRFQLLQAGFMEDILLDLSVGDIRVLTKPNIEKVVELVEARKKCGKGQMSILEFKELAKTFNTQTTNDEKALKKVESLIKFLDEAELKGETVVEIHDMLSSIITKIDSD